MDRPVFGDVADELLVVRCWYDVEIDEDQAVLLFGETDFSF
nr:hypothetical protein [Salinicoccus roseus]